MIKTNNIFGASDISFHLKRIFSLKESLKNGVVLPESSFDYYHGSASMILYPYINLIPLLILSFFIKSAIHLIYISYIFTEFCALLISFLCSFYYNKSYKISYLFSVIYCMSMMFLSYGFCSMDLGALSVLTVLPFVIFGFLNFIKYNKWIELSIGISLVIFSHVLSIFIIIGLIVFWILLNIKSLNKIKVFNIIKIISSVTLITAIVWLPAVCFSFFNLTNIISQANTHMVGISFFSLFKHGLLNNISYNLSLLPILAILLSIFYYRKFTRDLKQMLLISILIILFCSKIFPWKLSSFSIFKALGIFQFPWRFYLVPQILLSYILSVIIVKYIKYKNNKLRNALFFGILLLTLGLQIIGQNEIIHQNINSPSLTVAYLHKNFYDAIIHVHNTKYLPRPLYKLSNTRQVKFLSHYNAGPSFDYYPKDSMAYMYYINDNKGIIGKNRSIKFHNIGFNKYKFYKKTYKSSIHMPFLGYNKEHLNIYLNGQRVPYHLDSHNMITINNIKRGHYNILLQHIPDNTITLIKIIMFILGLVYYSYALTDKKRKIN